MQDKYAIIKDMIEEAERHADDMSHDRVRATEYYRGEMVDTPADQGRSRMVTRDVRAQIKKVLPSIVRTIFGAEQVVEYPPVGPGDEASAEQATEYVNRVVIPETDIRGCIYDAVHDALLLRNGILKWWWDERLCVKISSHSGLDEFALGELVAGDDVEVLEKSETVEADGTTTYSVKIRRSYVDSKIKASAVPRERFLIHPDATCMEDSLLTGEIQELRRSDLISMGYDRELVMSLPIAEEDDVEEDARRDTVTDTDEAQRANDPIDYYDVYIRVDMDGDDVSELRHMCFAGGLSERNLLLDEECDEVQFCDVAVMRQPHQWEGISLFDDLSDIQRAKTVLLRQTLDNIYWQNNPQPIVQGGAIKDMDAVYNPEFGKPIEVQNGISARDALGFNNVPFVARDSFAMMDYLDTEATDRTGVSDASAGLAPDALQNMTAKASAMIEQAGIGQTEMMVRTVAESLRPFFAGILRLIIRHQDKPRTVRLRDEWVQFDPRHWNSEMDAMINTGLGAGTRERDMMMMQQILMLQEKLIAAFGRDNPFVKPENIWNAISKIVEAAGLRSPDLYFTEPDPMEVQALLDKQRNAPSPEEMKAQAEQAKMQGQMQIEQAKMQANRDKEMAQMQADLTVEQKRIEADLQKQAAELAVRRQLQADQIAWEREKTAMEMEARRAEAAERRQDEIWKAQAAGFEPEKKESANG